MLRMPIAVSVCLYNNELENNSNRAFSQVVLKCRVTNGSLSDCNAMAGFEVEMKRYRTVIAIISIRNAWRSTKLNCSTRFRS